jgi:hypothetical protein
MKRALWAAVAVLACTRCGRGLVPSPDAGDSSDAGAVLDAGSGTADAGAPDSGTAVDAGKDGGALVGWPRGVFSAGFRASNAQDRQVLALPYVDGVFLPHFWNELEASAGQPDWTALDEDLAYVADAGKKVELALGAGMSSPPWLCAPDSGVQCLPVTFYASYSGACDALMLPVPWDRRYWAAFDEMAAALSEHLSDAGYQATVVTLKATGINEETFETILPRTRGGAVTCTGGTACIDGGCAQNDIFGALLDAGYSTQTMEAAYVAFAQIFRTRFPTRAVGVSASAALPPPPDAPSPDLATFLIQSAVDDGALRPLTVQDNGLAARYTGTWLGEDPGTAYARDAGVPIGFQMLGAVYGDTDCGGGMGKGLELPADAGCPEHVLRAAIDNGLDAGASWLEIYPEDLLHFPDAGAYAHERLNGPQPPGH